jgi:hypothetical protein
MAEPLDLPPPMVRRCARLHPHQAGRQLLKEGQDLTPPQLTPNHHRPCLINTMDLEYRLGEINTDRDNVSHGWLPFHVVTYTNHIMALRCRVGSRPQHHEQTIA